MKPRASKPTTRKTRTSYRHQDLNVVLHTVGETHDEAAEILTSYDVNLFVLVSLCERLDAAPEGCRVKAQCGDVPEQNALLRKIWDTPYGVCHKLFFLLE